MSKNTSNIIITKVSNGYIVNGHATTQVVEGDEHALNDFISKGIVSVISDKFKTGEYVKLTIEIENEKQKI